MNIIFTQSGEREKSLSTSRSEKRSPLADFFGEAFPLVGVTLKLFERATESRMPALERHFIRRMTVLEFFQYVARARAEKEIDEKSGCVRVRWLRGQGDAS